MLPGRATISESFLLRYKPAAGLDRLTYPASAETGRRSHSHSWVAVVMIESKLEVQPTVSTQSSDFEASTYRLFLVEDDDDLRRALTDYLSLEGYDMTTCADGTTALECLFTDGPFDLILLDVMLPGQNGFEILKSIRSAKLDAPTVMLTAKGSQEDILKGFELGADDYVPKPFSADVLEARLRAILTRTQPAAKSPMDVHEFGEMKINFTSNEVYRNGEQIAFTALEYDLLRYLINNRHKVISREKLLSDVWNLPPEVDTRTVDRHIASLRKKIEPSREDPQHILTVYGRGYRFEP